MLKFLVLLGISVTLPVLAQDPAHVGGSAGQLAREKILRKTQMVTLPFAMKLNPECLKGERKSVWDRLSKGEKVAFDELTDLFIEKHLANKKMTADEYTLFSRRIRDGVKSEDLHEIKTGYEAPVEKLLKKATVYNGESVSLTDLCKSNSLQCYSGTSLNQVMTRKILGMDLFNGKNMVILYEDGHVLPGYIVKTKEGNHLLGIETTATGIAKIDYGLVKDLRKDVRIVDANDWLLIEIYQDCLVKPEEEGTLVLNRAKNKFELSEIMPLDAAQARANQKSGLLNSSIFSFGKADVPKGNVERKNIGSIPRGSIQGASIGSHFLGKPIPEVIVSPYFDPGKYPYEFPHEGENRDHSFNPQPFKGFIGQKTILTYEIPNFEKDNFEKVTLKEPTAVEKEFLENFNKIFSQQNPKEEQFFDLLNRFKGKIDLKKVKTVFVFSDKSHRHTWTSGLLNWAIGEEYFEFAHALLAAEPTLNPFEVGISVKSGGGDITRLTLQETFRTDVDQLLALTKPWVNNKLALKILDSSHLTKEQVERLYEIKSNFYLSIEDHANLVLSKHYESWTRKFNKTEDDLKKMLSKIESIHEYKSNELTKYLKEIEAENNGQYYKNLNEAEKAEINKRQKENVSKYQLEIEGIKRAITKFKNRF